MYCSQYIRASALSVQKLSICLGLKKRGQRVMARMDEGNRSKCGKQQPAMQNGGREGKWGQSERTQALADLRGKEVQ